MLQQRVSASQRSNSRVQTTEGANCALCGSRNLEKLEAEISIHIAGLEDLDKSPAWVFPKLVVCLDCGIAHFTVPKTELRLLTEAAAPVKESIGFT
jgi:hypothetical protein